MVLLSREGYIETEENSWCPQVGNLVRAAGNTGIEPS